MSNNITIGQIGEDIAVQYLLNNKYKVIERNARYPWGEIDIIAKNKEGVLIFVEVKTLKMSHTSVKHSQNCFTPEENLHTTKLNKVRRTAYLYANSRPNLIDDNMGWRIDLIAIEINYQNPESVSPKELIKHCEIRHYENI